MRGTSLAVEVDPDERPHGDEEFYDRHLRGLRVIDHLGEEVGDVADVVHLPSQDLLVIATPAGERYVPFVAALVPEVDLAALDTPARAAIFAGNPVPEGAEPLAQAYAGHQFPRRRTLVRSPAVEERVVRGA